MSPEPPAWPQTGAFEGRAAFQAAVLGVIHHCASRGVRRMWWCSPDWEGWPLEEPMVVSALTAWCRGTSASLVWLAQDYSAFQGRLSRLMRWRRDWSHRMRCLSPLPDEVQHVPTLLVVDDQCVVEWMDPHHGRGRVSDEPGDVAQARLRIDAISQRCTEALPVTTLGI